jgi:murein DD-endopeptidase MepM/ murein hydrolase activator NlpD
MSVARSAFSLTALSVLAFTGFKLSHTPPGSLDPPTDPSTDPSTMAAPLSEPATPMATRGVQQPAPVLERVVKHTILKGETFGGILSRYGIPGVTSIVQIAAPHKDLTQIRAGQVLTFRFEEETPASITYALDEDRTLVISLSPEGPSAELDEVRYEVGLETRILHLDSSLWAAAMAAGLRPADIAHLAEIFEYEVDFNTELRAGARLVLVGDGLYNDGQFVRLGDLRAVQLENDGHTYSALRHEHSDGDVGWYHPDGTASKRAFLRSPLAFSRVTSGFDPRRYHPILKKTRPHNGTDFGARTGTPVRAVSDGRVVLAGRNGGYGNQVKLDHAGPYTTSYSHLQKLKVRNGQRVKQGDIIGTVGSTGLATGPHLHFEMRINGKPVNALKVDLPTSVPLPASERARFEQTRTAWLPMLEAAAAPAVAGIE